MLKKLSFILIFFINLNVAQQNSMIYDLKYVIYEVSYLTGIKAHINGHNLRDFLKKYEFKNEPMSILVRLGVIEGFIYAKKNKIKSIEDIDKEKIKEKFKKIMENLTPKRDE